MRGSRSKRPPPDARHRTSAGNVSVSASTGEMKAMVPESVRSTFNYTRDTGVMPEVYFYEPPAGTPIRDPGDDPHEMLVLNGWGRVSEFSLDRDGFALREFQSPFDRWDDDEAIKARFYGDVIAFLKREVGAS